jgi:predicted N-acyltransferase
LTIDCVTETTQDILVRTDILSSIKDIDQKDWDCLNTDNNPYLSRKYLSALEESLPYFDFRYVIFYNEKKETVGIAYCQIIKITQHEINTEALSNRLGSKLPNTIINSLDLRVLICGNAFATGENGFIFHPSISSNTAFDLLTSVIEEINLVEKKHKKKISITLIKEFWPEHFKNSQHFKEMGCCEVNIDVNMVLKLDDSWKTFADYLAAMNSKFRTKAKQVFAKSADLQLIDFTPEIIEERLDEINSLYNMLVDKASFSFGRLNATTLLFVKKELGDNFFFRGYYLKGQLIGFSTATNFNGVLDGNYIGLDYEFNQDYAVYQRMLYDFVEHAFKTGAREIRIGRTAEEIKSGVGALPVEMKFYAKHRNKVTNALLRPFVQKLKPSDFNLRRPFKAEYYSN